MTWAAKTASSPSISDQDDPDNVITLAQALVYARTGDQAMRSKVITALGRVQTSSVGRALALGRELGAYVLAADYIGYRDPAFGAWVSRMRTVATSGGPASLTSCSEVRLNNWQTWCLASRLIASTYLGDATDVSRSVAVFRGWLGDRSQYVGFDPGDTSWQCDPAKPVGINPPCVKLGFDIGGVLPDDQRRGGSFSTDPPCENYVWEAIQSVTLTATVLSEAGYPAFDWSDRAIVRAFDWLYANDCPATGDDTGSPWVPNHYAGTDFATSAANPGKGWGYQDWLLQ